MQDLIKDLKKAETKTADSKAITTGKANKANKAKSKVKVQTVYALQSTPRGKALFTYMLSIFAVLGMFTAGRKAGRKEAIRAFFQSPTAIKHHTANGNLEETKDGKVRLTVAGWNYFQGRLTGQTIAQEVDRDEMKVLAAALKAGKLSEKTARFAIDTKFKRIDIPA